jgi:hypothetical protein
MGLQDVWAGSAVNASETCGQAATVLRWERDASHNSHMVLFIVKTKTLECPYGIKGKLQLMNGSLVQLS